MFEVFLFGFHLLNFAADAGNFLFNFEDVADFSGAFSEDGLETLCSSLVAEFAMAPSGGVLDGLVSESFMGWRGSASEFRTRAGSVLREGRLEPPLTVMSRAGEKFLDSEETKDRKPALLCRSGAGNRLKDWSGKRMVLDVLDGVGPLLDVFAGGPLGHDEGVRVVGIPSDFRQTFAENAGFYGVSVDVIVGIFRIGDDDCIIAERREVEIGEVRNSGSHGQPQSSSRDLACHVFRERQIHRMAEGAFALHLIQGSGG
jgi:hypothetical protein